MSDFDERLRRAREARLRADLPARGHSVSSAARAELVPLLDDLDRAIDALRQEYPRHRRVRRMLDFPHSYFRWTFEGPYIDGHPTARLVIFPRGRSTVGAPTSKGGKGTPHRQWILENPEHRHWEPAYDKALGGEEVRWRMADVIPFWTDGIISAIVADLPKSRQWPR